MAAAWLHPRPDEPHSRLKNVSIFTPRRLDILNALRSKPGVSLSELGRALGVHGSTVESNVHILEGAGLLRRERDGKRVRVYLVGVLSERDAFLARLGPSAFVYEAIERGVPGRAVTLAHELGITRHAARSHLRRLAQLGAAQVREVRVLRSEVRFVVTPAERD